MIGVVGAGLQMLTNIGTAIANRQKEKRQREYNQQDYQQQLTDQKAMIADERQYNSPISALTRLRQAGLNDHLAYGNAISVNNSYQKPSPIESTQTEAMPFDLSALAEMGQSFKQNKIDIAFKNQQLKSLTLDNEIKEESLDELKKVARIKNDEISASAGLKDQLTIESAKKIEKMRSEIENLDARTAQQELLNTMATDKEIGILAMKELEKASKVLENKLIQSKIDMQSLEKEKLEQTIEQLKKNNRILEQNAILWEKGIKPNATLQEQLLDEFLYAAVQSESLGLSITEGLLTEIPVVGPILKTIIQLRRKNIENVNKNKDK